ncbi:alpha/beta hydrolase [Tessaracoccus sp. G1721]
MSALSPSGRLARAWHEVADWAVAGRDMAKAIWRRHSWRLPAGDGGDKGCGQVTVVLIPGILEPWSYLAPLARWLGRRGHRVEFIEGLGWNLGHLDASADHCLEVLRARGVRDAVLVAHSKGGLIGKAVLTRQGEDGVALGLVAVATPFGGSSMGRPLHRLVSRSPLGLFAPGNAVLRRLSAEVAVNAQIVSLAPAWDQVIPDGSHLAGATNVDLDSPGHFRPMRDEAVWEIIHEHVHRLAG